MSDTVLVKLNQEQTLLRKGLIEAIQNLTKRKLMWIIEIFDSRKNKIESDHGLRTRYTRKEMAEQDLEMYRKTFPEYEFELKEVEIV